MHTNPEVLALMALGEDIGTPPERQHVTGCPACSEEVAELARIADVGRTSNASESFAAPSAEVWHRIAAELGFRETLAGAARPTVSQPPAAQVATVTGLAAQRDNARGGTRGSMGGADSATPTRAQPTSAPRTSAARRYAALAIAAALALIVGIGVGISYERQVVRPENRVIASAELRPLPKFEGATGTAEVFADGRGGRELVVKMTSPTPVNGTVQVWLMDAQGRATSMGTMTNGVARLPIQPGMSLFERPTVDISDEPAQDPDPGHNGDSILRGKLI
jgi:hypothetical protein